MALTRADKRSRAVFDYTLCFGGPFIVGACEIIYQPARFALVRTLGCEAVHSNTWPTLVLWLIWPPICAALGVLYSSECIYYSSLGAIRHRDLGSTLTSRYAIVYTAYRLFKHRQNFGRVVSGAHSALTTSRFIRLASLSFMYLLVGLPLAIYTTLVDISSSDQYFDYNWEYLHSIVSRDSFEADLPRSRPQPISLVSLTFVYTSDERIDSGRHIPSYFTPTLILSTKRG